MQFKRVLPISDNPTACKETPYQNRTSVSIQKQYVQEFKDSGLKQVEFCKQHNIHYKTFTNWLRRCRDETVKTLINPAKELISATRCQDCINTEETATTLICTLPNGLGITLNLKKIADLTNIIEMLSQCKLN